MMNRVKVLITFVLILSVLLAWSAPAKAGMAVVPSKIEISLPPGGQQDVDIDVFSDCKNPLKVQAKSWDFARDEKGNPYPIKPEDVKTFRGCGGWLNFLNRSVTVAPNQTGTVRFTVKVPGDVRLGTYYTYVALRGVPDIAPKKGVSMPVGYTINALLLVTVGGEQTSEQNSPPILKRSASLKHFSVNTVNFHNPVPMLLEIENKGNVHLNLKGTIEIWKDKYKGEAIPVQEFTLLPESTLKIPASWEKPPLFGKFTAKFKGDVGLEKPLIAEEAFWVINQKILVGTAGTLVFLLGLAFFFRWRIKKKESMNIWHE